jgi:stress response protein YsnF
MADEREVRVPIAEERAAVELQRLSLARVRVKTETQHTKEMLRAELHGEDVEITRVPMEAEIDEPPAIRNEGDVTVVPVVEERLVVQKRLVLVEEIHIRRRRTTEPIEIPVMLRRQRAVVERQELSDEEKPLINPSSKEDQTHG